MKKAIKFLIIILSTMFLNQGFAIDDPDQRRFPQKSSVLRRPPAERLATILERLEIMERQIIGIANFTNQLIQEMIRREEAQKEIEDGAAILLEIQSKRQPKDDVYVEGTNQD